MQTQNGIKWGCGRRLFAISLLIMGLVLLGGKLYTDAIVRNAEATYPPGEFVTVEGVRLHYVKAGSGQPLVIIHGGSGKTQDFVLSPLFEMLTDEYQVFVFDRPGLGYSEKPDEEATPMVQARLLHAAVQALGIEDPILLGQSWGGVIAMAIAQDYPEDVSGIVLLGSSPYPRERTLPFFDKIALMPVVGDLILHTLYVPIGRHWIAPGVIRQNVDYFAPLETVPESYYAATLELGLRPAHLKRSAEEKIIIPQHLPGVVDRLGEIEVPVMIVVGELDTNAVAAAPRLEQDLPLTELRVVAGANHYLWFPFPEAVVEAVAETAVSINHLNQTNKNH